MSENSTGRCPSSTSAARAAGHLEESARHGPGRAGMGTTAPGVRLCREPSIHKERRMPALTVAQSQLVEVDLGPAPDDAWAELDVDVTTPGGESRVVPAFVRDGSWRLRYAAEET